MQFCPSYELNFVAFFVHFPKMKINKMNPRAILCLKIPCFQSLSYPALISDKIQIENFILVYDNDYQYILLRNILYSQLKHLELAIHSLDTLSDVRIKAFKLLF
jgi:hypothetical protein